MSIFSSLYTGANGLTAHGDAISVVGDDIANASTVGFKENRAEFQDMIGGRAGNGQNLGQGVRMAGTDVLFGQGTIQNTGQPYDMAVQGNGFFVVKGNFSGVAGNYYTRDGQFKLDSTGTLVNAQGLHVQGYTVDATGKQSQAVSDLVIGGQSSPNPTTKLTMAANLDSASVTPAAPWDPLNPGTTSNYSTSSTVYDSLGNSHRVDLYFRDNGGGNWDYHAMVDGGELAGGVAGTPTEIGTGTLTFTTAGALQAQTGSATASFVGATASQPIALNFGDDIASGGTGLAGSTQYAGASAVNSLNQDGYGAGQLTTVQVANDGTITGQFSNGQSRPIARVALATFASDKGLQRAGSQLFEETRDSGQALVDAAQTGGRGAVLAGSLESSNVDLGKELVTLIAYQRAFSANSKTVQTADEMLQEISNLKR